MNRKAALPLVLALSMAPVSFAYGITREYHFKLDAPEIRTVASETVVTMPGCSHYGKIGEPVLPRKLVRLAIPGSSEVRQYRIAAAGEREVKIKFPVQYQRAPMKLVRGATPPVTKANAAVYESGKFYPSVDVKLLGYQFKHGVKIAVFEVMPVRYLPLQDLLRYFTDFTLSVELDAAAKTAAKGVRGALENRDIKELESVVDNKGEMEQLAVPRLASAPRLDATNYTYVIIAPAVFTNDVTPNYDLWDLLNHRKQRGYSTKLVTVEYIDANYSGTRPDGGTDLHTKIRNFITFAYQNWGTRFVLLAGDGDTANASQNYIPARGMKMSMEGEDAMIADMYYGCLDGTYDYNADGQYGEVNDGPGGGIPDIFAEVHVGRAPIDGYNEIHNFVGKVIQYEKTLPDSPYAKRAAMLGEYLGAHFCPPYGGTCMDEIADGSTNFGYTTAGFPGDWDVYRLYDRDSDWPSSEISALVNTGNYQLFSHLGHANVTYVMKLYNSGLDALVNEKPIFVYSQGCYPGSFDNRDSYGSYGTEDCAAEHLVLGEDGAFAVVMNSRYGFGSGSYENEGPSQVYNREFFDALWGEEMYLLGEMNDDSKADKVDYFTNAEIGRWCCYQQNLIGDPATRVADFLSASGCISLDPRMLTTGSFLSATVSDMDLTNQASHTISLFTGSGDAEALTVYPSAIDSPVFTQSVLVVYNGVATPGNGVIEAVHGTVITGQYIDAHTEEGNVATNSAVSLVDAQAPVITGVAVSNVSDTQATVTWLTDESARGDVVLVSAGTNYAETEYALSHEMVLADLAPATKHYFCVVQKDMFGHTSTNDNGGAYFSFSTKLFIPDWETDVETEEPDKWSSTTGWHRSQRHPFSGSYSWYCGDEVSGEYDNYADCVLWTATITSDESNVSLKFKEYISTEYDYDYCYVQISTNGGADWIDLRERVCGTCADRDVALPLNDYCPGAFSIRFRFTSDLSVTMEGWYIDDIRVGTMIDSDLVISGTEATDPAPGGDGDGYIEPGETVLLEVTLFNGLDYALTNLCAELSSVGEYVSLIQNSSSYGTVPAKENATNIPLFSFAVATNAPDGASLPFILVCTNSIGQAWSNDFNLGVQYACEISGLVRYKDFGTPISNATVYCDAGSVQSTTTDGAGAFRITGLPAAIYDVWADAEDYIACDSIVLDCPPDRTNVILELGKAVLEYAPASLFAQVPQFGSGERTLVISNAGNGRLTFSLQTSNSMILAEGFDNSNEYRWIDSDEPSCPAFEWLDISDGQEIVLDDDSVSGALALQHAFPFYSRAFTTLWIHSNGGISIAETNRASASNYQFPATYAPDSFIAPCWDDLNPEDGGHIYFKSTPQMTVVSFVDIPRYSSWDPGTFSFQVILYPSGAIKYQYLRAEGTIDSCTVGWQGEDKEKYANIAHNTDYVRTNLVVVISRPDEWLVPAQFAGEVEPGAALDIPVAFHAYEFDTGMYHGAIEILSDGGDATVPATMEVIEAASLRYLDFAISNDTDGDGLPESGEDFDIDVLISNFGAQAASDVTIIITSTNKCIHFSGAEYSTNTWAGNHSETARFAASLTNDVPDGTHIACRLELTFDGYTNVEYFGFTIVGRYMIQGHVMYKDYGTPISNAQVYCQPDKLKVAFTDGDGEFKLTDLSSGSFTVWAEADGFIAGEVTNFACPPDATGLTIEIGKSLLASAPDTLYAILQQTESVERDLVISNVGNALLTFSLQTSNSTVLLSGFDNSNEYRWIDSDDGSCPAFDWIDISGDGQVITLTDDSVSGALALQHPFPFYSGSHALLWIHSNGGIGLVETNRAYWLNSTFPAGNTPAEFIAPCWDDLDPAYGGHIYFKSTPEQTVVSFVDIERHSTTDTGTFSFQIILYPSGATKYQYLRAEGVTDSCTVGWQGENRTKHATIAYNTAYVRTNFVVLIARPDEWLVPTEFSGEVKPGQAAVIPIEFNAHEMETGTYHGAILIASDGGGATVPTTLDIVASNSPPVFLSPTNHSCFQVFVGHELCIPLSAEDAEYDECLFSATNLPPTAELLSNQVYYTPGYGEVDMVYTSVLTVTDNGLPAQSSSVQVYITVVPEAGMMVGIMLTLLACMRSRAQ